MSNKISTKINFFPLLNLSTFHKIKKIELDIKILIGERIQSLNFSQNLIIIEFFSANITPKKKSKNQQILNAINYFGLINQAYLVLSTTNIEKELTEESSH